MHSSAIIIDARRRHARNELRMRGLIFLLADSQSRAPRGAAAAAAARARAPPRAWRRRWPAPRAAG
jgi:hypothetical protein